VLVCEVDVMVALPLLSVWLEQNFGAYGWTPAVAGLLLIVVKVIEVMRSAPPDTLEVMMAARETAPEPSKVSRILWG
jgi:hypothetical protein